VARSRLRSPLSVATIIACTLTSLTLAAAEPQENASFYLRDGDRVVFYGDSITEQAYYTRSIEVYLRTRCPQLDVSFFNAGWAGDRAWGGDGGMLEERLKRDVIAHQPTVVTVMLGMNDGYYANHSGEALRAFEERIETLIATLKRELPGVRITLLGSSPFDNVTPGEPPDWERGIEGGYNSVVAHYVEVMEKLAERHDLVFVDMNAPLVEALQQLQEADPSLARQLIPDRIHPGPAAGLLMAAHLLDAWHVPHSEYAAQIDFRDTDSVASVRRELSLPFPIDTSDPLVSRLVSNSPAMKVFAGNVLRVTNMRHETARVTVDGDSVGVFSRSELERGISLTPPKSPLGKRATEVARLVALADQVRFINWRQLRIELGNLNSLPLMTARDELAEVEQRLETLACEAARPTSHVIRVSQVAQ
jgi:lysophospholipase L1-like esterase